MRNRDRILVRWGGAALLWLGAVAGAWAQGPTLPEPLSPGGLRAGGSSLGRPLGSADTPVDTAPGTQSGILGSRPGASTPRIAPTPAPTGVQTPPDRGFITPTPALDPAALPQYGQLAIPRGPEDEGPADGMTLDQAIDRLVRENLTLRAQFFEIPQADADILTASLRANPILYADSQLVPYGQYSSQRPGGPVQYDLNVTYPLDVTRKRLARTEVATRAKRVLESQFQDAVRLQIDNLYTAYVDVLAARETLRFAVASREGLKEVLDKAEVKFREKAIFEAEVNRVRIQYKSAQLFEADAAQTLVRNLRTLGTLLNVPPAESSSLRVRGSIQDPGLPLPPVDALIGTALQSRPDLVAFRLGVQRAMADVGLQRANRLSDVYLLYQPYTFQNNAPFGTRSATSWALGVTVPLPVYNRNQGNIRRAEINVGQTQTELAALERTVINEVQQAANELEVALRAVGEAEATLLPQGTQVLETFRIQYEQGQIDPLVYLNARRDYNDVVRLYRDALIRRRRAMLGLNTAIGRRVMP